MDKGEIILMYINLTPSFTHEGPHPTCTMHILVYYILLDIHPGHRTGLIGLCKELQLHLL